MVSRIAIITLFTIFLLVTILADGQPYSMPNETVILSFTTVTGKKVILSKEKKDRYLVYRFGTKDKVEFQYPDTSINSWKLFKYSFWVRGGGTDNEGINLNYLAFTNNHFKYIIYSTYFAVSNKMSIGVKVIDLNTSKITDIKGNTRTQHGSLAGFRENALIATDDELYN